MFKFLLFRVLPCLLLAQTAARAQSLADVLSSIQERKQVLEQREQMVVHLQRTYTEYQPDIPEQNLIDWEGLGTIFPSDSDTAGLGIDGRILLLNQAIRELRDLQGSFLNFRKEDLVQGAKAGAMRLYMMEDFPDPGRANQENYHQVLRLVAQSVRRLSVLEWAVAGHKVVNQTDLIENTGENISENWEYGYGEAFIERCHFTHDSAGKIQKDYYFDNIALYAAVPDADEQITGKVAIVFRNNWSSITWASQQVTAPTSWEPNDGSCQVALAEDGPSQEYAMDAPEITLGLETNTIETPFGPNGEQ